MTEIPSNRVHCIVAMTNSRLIGYNNTIPWKIPEDMQHFKQMTLGKAVIMGRETWLSIPAKFRPLPGRTNIILSRNETALVAALAGADQAPRDEVLTACSIPHALERARHRKLEPWIIGGGQVYAAALPYVTDLHVTNVMRDFPIPSEYTDRAVYFPKTDEFRLQSAKPLAGLSDVMYVHYVRKDEKSVTP